LKLLYNVVSKRHPWPLGAFENRRSFTLIDNLCFVICEAMGRKAQIGYLPKKVMNGLAWMGGKLHLPLNPERLRKLTEN